MLFYFSSFSFYSFRLRRESVFFGEINKLESGEVKSLTAYLNAFKSEQRIKINLMIKNSYLIPIFFIQFPIRIKLINFHFLVSYIKDMCGDIMT